METIVLAEDYLDFHEFFESSLGKHYKIIFFNNGLDCYNFLKDTDEKINLILSDFEMPFMNGAQLAKKLQEDGCQIPIVLMSMHIPEKERAKIGDEVKIIIDKPQMFNEGILKTIKRVFEELGIDKGSNPSP